LVSVHWAVSVVIVSIIVAWCSSTVVTSVGVSVATVTVGVSGASIGVTVSVSVTSIGVSVTSVRVSVTTVSVGVTSVTITTVGISSVSVSVSVSVARVTGTLSVGGLGYGLRLVCCRSAGGSGVGLAINVVETRGSVGTAVRSGGIDAQITTASELTAVDGSGTLGVSGVRRGESGIVKSVGRDTTVLVVCVHPHLEGTRFLFLSVDPNYNSVDDGERLEYIHGAVSGYGGATAACRVGKGYWSVNDGQRAGVDTEVVVIRCSSVKSSGSRKIQCSIRDGEKVVSVVRLGELYGTQKVTIRVSLGDVGVQESVFVSSSISDDRVRVGVVGT